MSKDQKIQELEECLAGFMVCGAINGMYLPDDIADWCETKLKDKKRTPVQVWQALYAEIDNMRGLC